GTVKLRVRHQMLATSADSPFLLGRICPRRCVPSRVQKLDVLPFYQIPSDVRDHRVATRGRRRAWRLTAPAPLAFSSGFGLIFPVYHIHQSNPVGCRLETSWNRGLSPSTPSGRFPFPHTTRPRPPLPSNPIYPPRVPSH